MLRHFLDFSIHLFKKKKKKEIEDKTKQKNSTNHEALFSQESGTWGYAIYPTFSAVSQEGIQPLLPALLTYYYFAKNIAFKRKTGITFLVKFLSPINVLGLLPLLIFLMIRNFMGQKKQLGNRHSYTDHGSISAQDVLYVFI